MFRGIVDRFRGECEQPVLEIQAGSLVEVAIGIGRELIACTVDPEIFGMLQTLRMGEKHATNGESTETELEAIHHLTSTTHGLTTMQLSELRRHDQDVAVRLLSLERLEDTNALGGLPELVGTELALVVVIEIAVANLTQERKYFFQGFTVGGGDGLPPRNGEVLLGER